jgi:hypothetical protein
VESYGTVDLSLVSVLKTARLVCLTTWCWTQPARDPKTREAAEYHLKTLKAAGKDWSTLTAKGFTNVVLRPTVRHGPPKSRSGRSPPDDGRRFHPMDSNAVSGEYAGLLVRWADIANDR